MLLSSNGMIRFSNYFYWYLVQRCFLFFFICRVTEIAKDRLEYYFTQKGYNMYLFPNLECSEYVLIQSLINLMQFEDDDLQFSSCKLLFAIVHAEKALFSKATSSYIYTSKSEKVNCRITELATFRDGDKILLKMLQGHLGSGEECIFMLFLSLLTSYFAAKGRKWRKQGTH